MLKVLCYRQTTRGLAMEIWRDVPGYIGLYQVSSKGRVRRLRDLDPMFVISGMRMPLNFLKPQSGYKGRLRVNLCKGGETQWHQVHRLVMVAFKGFQPLNVLHNDGNHLNNHIWNLRWGNQKENMADKVLHGTQTQGETHPVAKLTEADVVVIRASTETQRELAARYGVSQVNIHNIKSRKTWKHVQ